MTILCSPVLLASSLSLAAAATCPAQEVASSAPTDETAAALLEAMEERIYSPREAGLETLYAEFDGRIVNFPLSTTDRVYRGRTVWAAGNGFRVNPFGEASALSGALTLLGNLEGGLTGESSMLPELGDATIILQGEDRIVIQPAANTAQDVGSALGWSGLAECFVELDGAGMPGRIVVTGVKHPGVPEQLPNQMDTTMRWREAGDGEFVLERASVAFWIVDGDGARSAAQVPFHSMTYETTYQEIAGLLLPVAGRSTIVGRRDEEQDPRVDSVVLHRIRVNGALPQDLDEFLDSAQIDELLEPAPPLEAGDVAPQWELTDLDGDAVSLEDLRGKVVVLDFWATWCGPCRKALPAIQRISERFGDDEVAVVGLAVFERERALADDAREVREAVAQHELTYPIVIADDTVAEAYHLSSIPQVFVIDAAGVIRMRHGGFSEDLEELVAKQVQELLGARD